MGKVLLLNPPRGKKIRRKKIRTIKRVRHNAIKRVIKIKHKIKTKRLNPRIKVRHIQKFKKGETVMKGKIRSRKLKRHGILGVNPVNPVNPWVKAHMSHSIQRVPVHVDRYHRKAKHNPAGFLSKIRRNPMVAGVMNNVVHPFSISEAYSLLALSTGAVAAPFVSSLVLGAKYDNRWWRLGGNIGSSIALASLTKMVFKNTEIAKNVLNGGLLGTIVQEIVALVKKAPANALTTRLNTALSPALTGLGATDAELKKKIEAEVMKNLGVPKSYPSYATAGVGMVRKPESSYFSLGSDLMDTAL